MCLYSIQSYVESRILYEDNHIIAVLKDANILTQSDSSNNVSLFEYVKNYIKIKYNKKGNVFLGLLHRLDRPVSGVVLFAKTSKAASRLSESIRDRSFEKKYYAIVHGILKEKESILENYIIKQSNKMGHIAKVVFENGNAKYAKLCYRVLDENINKNLSMIYIELETGRFHQIRVQFATLGHAIYGDRKYGSYIKKGRDDVLLALFAKKIIFKHPIKNTVLSIEARLPRINPWDMFCNNYKNV